MIKSNNNQPSEKNQKIIQDQKSQQFFEQNLQNQKSQNKYQDRDSSLSSTNQSLSHFSESNQFQINREAHLGCNHITQSEQYKPEAKQLENNQTHESQKQMISLSHSNQQIEGAGDTACSDQVETGKEIGSETLVPAQNQYEEEDTQVCELLLQAQECKENQQQEQAEKIYFDVLSIQKQKHGNTSYQVASTYKKLASMFQKAKDYDAALKYYNEALNICKNQGGQSHSSREATCLISMSNIFLLKENIEEAQQFVTRALHIYNTQTLEDEQMKPLLISQALRLKRKIDMHEKQKQYEERQIALSQEQTICSICLEDIQKNKRIRQLNCGHVYHIKCIAQWLQLNSKCPYCRDILPKPH